MGVILKNGSVMQTNLGCVVVEACASPTWLTLIIRCVAFLVAALLPLSQGVWGQTARPDSIGFKSGTLELKGFVWKPSGEGPFPALLWNHGSEKLPGSVDTVAPYFVAKGYVFFVPHRRGQGRSPGPYIMDELNQAARGAIAVGC